MKILLFTDTLWDTNGVSRFLQNLGTHGNGLLILTATRKPALVSSFPWKNLPYRLACTMPFYAQLDIVIPSFRAAQKALEEFQPDAIHVSTPGPMGLIGRHLALRYNLPLVGVYHTDFPSYAAKNLPWLPSAFLARAYMRWFYRPFSLVLTRNPNECTTLSAQIPSPLRALPFGVDTALFRPQELPKNSVFTLLYVGRVSTEKNVDFLWNVWEKLALLYPKEKLCLWCVGEWPHAALYHQGKALGITFLGRKSPQELPALYTQAHLLVFPSTTETLGQVVLESLACGTPVLVSTQGGPQAILQSTKAPCGLALDVKNPEHWAHAIIELKNNLDTRTCFVKAALEEDFSFQKSFLGFWEVHERVAKKKGGPNPKVRRKRRLDENEYTHQKNSDVNCAKYRAKQPEGSCGDEARTKPDR